MVYPPKYKPQSTDGRREDTGKVSFLWARLGWGQIPLDGRGRFQRAVSPSGEILPLSLSVCGGGSVFVGWVAVDGVVVAAVSPDIALNLKLYDQGRTLDAELE